MNLSDVPFTANSIVPRTQNSSETEFVRDDFSTKFSDSNSEFEEWNPLSNSKSSSLGDLQNPAIGLHSGGEDAEERNGDVSAAREIDESKETIDGQFEKGFREGRAEAERNLQTKVDEVDALLKSLKKGHCDISEFYAPLKSLTVKAVEAVLKVELPESKAAIERMVSDILGSIGSLADAPVKVGLAKQDYENYSEAFRDQFSSVEFVMDPKLSRGSTYAEMSDRTINDFSEDRLAEIVEKIFSNE